MKLNRKTKTSPRFKLSNRSKQLALLTFHNKTAQSDPQNPNYTVIISRQFATIKFKFCIKTEQMLGVNINRVSAICRAKFCSTNKTDRFTF